MPAMLVRIQTAHYVEGRRIADPAEGHAASAGMMRA
jgi:protein-disulfide isomerase-like protein with CxxC motif